MMRLCLLIACLLAICTGAAQSKTRACQAINYTVSKVYPGMGHVRVTYRIFFATNNAVQMYSLVRSSHNQEVDHTALLQLQKIYGLEFVNAPPLRIVSYKKKSGDLSVPDRAVDSCGRMTYFH
ncbi:MAG: hypothetical protein M3N19_05080 [Candidatus Eremiobacteraeota bacterium]|nr:hypothetical protein [Candidatus Eremiobacteraeota bacterium]